MTETLDEKNNIRSLVFMHDLSTLGIDSHIPTHLKNYEITQELLNKYCPSLEDRAEDIAKQACWYAYVSITKKPDLNEFSSYVLPHALQTVKESIVLKIKPDVSLETIKEIIRVQSLNLTQVDKDRQIQ